MEERRHSPRYRCDLQVELTGHNDDAYMAEACDISAEGISLLVPREAVANLSETGLNCDVGCRIKISFPDAGAESGDRIVCTVAHTNRLSQEQYFVGLSFEDFRDDTSSFINSLLKNTDRQE